MSFPVKMVYPVGDTFAMVLVQTDQGRKLQPKTISAHTQEELDRLESIGWKVKE